MRPLGHCVFHANPRCLGWRRDELEPVAWSVGPDAVGAEAIETLIVPRARDLGGFEVRRALPAPERQMVGPFIFFDQMGPVEFLTGTGSTCARIPHIGLATVTYLFDGEIQHRDSLGLEPVIVPGEVNWMVAGRGITHSERTARRRAQAPHRLFGIQTWVALPEARGGRGAELRAPGEGVAPCHRERRRERPADPRPSVRGNRAGPRLFRDVLRRRRSRARRPPAASRRLRGLRALRRRGLDLVAGQTFEAGRMMVFRPRGPDRRRRRPQRRAPDPPRRRDARRAPLHPVELRRLEPGEDRGRQGGVAQGRLGP